MKREKFSENRVDYDPGGAENDPDGTPGSRRGPGEGARRTLGAASKLVFPETGETRSRCGGGTD